MDSTINTAQISAQTEAAVTEVLNSAGLEAGDVFVIGCSTSEISGGIIGKNSNEKAGIAVASAALRILNERGIFLAVQSCEHLNRALVIEKRAAKAYALCEVSAVPSVNAGGACASAAFTLAENPVLVEHISAKAGLDIGDTEIGMHISFVQVPLRLKNNLIGNARVTALKSRPKLIGGERTRYTL